MDLMCFVGRPNAPMMYFKVGGAAPSGSFPGEDAIPFNPASLQAVKVGTDWHVVDGPHGFALENNSSSKVGFLPQKS
jgi:hypothetical protein